MAVGGVRGMAGRAVSGYTEDTVINKCRPSEIVVPLVRGRRRAVGSVPQAGMAWSVLAQPGTMYRLKKSPAIHVHALCEWY